MIIGRAHARQQNPAYTFSLLAALSQDTTESAAIAAWAALAVEAALLCWQELQCAGKNYSVLARITDRGGYECVRDE